MSSFKEAFESITKSRHYEPPSTSADDENASNSTSIPINRSRTTPPPSSSSASVSVHMRNPAAILASPRQKMNPILKYIRSVPLEFSSDPHMVSDFAISNTTVALYLSIKYHKLNPEYLIGRMEAVKRHYRLRLVLIQIDDIDCELALLRIQTLCVSNGFTAICAYTEEEAARYLEIYKKNEKRGSEDIEEKKNLDYVSRATDTLTQIRGVNKSDVKNLLRNFNSVGSILDAPMEELALCVGIGEKKIARMHTAFNEPFFASQSKTEGETVERDSHVDIVALEEMAEDPADDEDDEM